MDNTHTTPSDLGFNAGLNDLLENVSNLFDSADRTRGCYYTAMGASDTEEKYRENRLQHEFYDGKCDAYADTLKWLRHTLECIKKEQSMQTY